MKTTFIVIHIIFTLSKRWFIKQNIPSPRPLFAIQETDLALPNPELAKF